MAASQHILYPPLDELSACRQSLKLLQSVNRAVNASFMMEEMIETLADVLLGFMPFAELGMVIVDDTQNGIALWARVQPGGAAELVRENNRFAGTDPLLDMLLNPPHALPLITAGGSGEGDGLQALLQRSSLFSVLMGHALAVPLTNNNRIQGLLALGFEVAPTPQEQTTYQEWLNQVAEPLSLAVENAKLYWKTQAQSSRSFLINRLTHAMRNSLDIASILHTTVSELGRVMGVSRCIVRYLDNEQTSEKGVLRQFAYTLPGVSPAPKTEDPEKALETHVFRLRHGDKTLKENDTNAQKFNPFVLNDIRDCPEPLCWALAEFQQLNVQSLVVIPVWVGGHRAGSLTLHQCGILRTWTDDDLTLLEAIADHLGVALTQAQLFATQARQTAELEDALQELQTAQLQLIQSEKMAVLGQFVAGIAHEVNTPLGAMTSNNSTLSACVARLPAELGTSLEGHERLTGLLQTMRDLLEINQMASQRIQEIVRSLRNFARLDESEQKRVDIHEGIENTLILLRSTMSSRVTVNRQFDPHSPQVLCYPGLLNQVLMNLMINALHAMADNPSDRACVLTVGTAWDPMNRQLYLTVEDTGKGIPAEHRNRIFDPGFTTKGVGVGTGLGLALCYRIMEKHHGQIEMESTVNQGTNFVVTLPQ